MWVTNSRTHSTDGIQGRADLGHFWLCPEVKTTLVYKRCASKLFIVFHIGPLFLKVLLPPSWGGEETEPLVRRHSSLIEHVLYVCPIAWNLWMLIDLIISRAWKTAVLQEKKKKNACFADSAWSCTPLITVLTLWVQVSMVYRVRLFPNKQTNEHINKEKKNQCLPNLDVNLLIFCWHFIPFVRCKWDTLNFIFVQEPKCLALLYTYSFPPVWPLLVYKVFSPILWKCLPIPVVYAELISWVYHFLAIVTPGKTTFPSKCRPAISLLNTCGDYTEPCEEKSLAIGRKKKFLEIHVIKYE